MKKIYLVLPLLALPLAVLAVVKASPASSAEVRALTDRREITELVDRLGSALDEGRFEDLNAVYTADATAQTPGGTAAGRAALIAQASRNHGPELRVQHLISNVVIDLRGDTAGVRANLLVLFASAGGEAAPQPRFTLGEVYHFDAVRTAEGWRLSRVQTTPIWSFGERP